jgi:hypothetical protein
MSIRVSVRDLNESHAAWHGECASVAEFVAARRADGNTLNVGEPTRRTDGRTSIEIREKTEAGEETTREYIFDEL